ncbi:MAG: ORF6N domain-containing protein [Bacteroides sp.]|nr:ORF6N domain-containing protein [Bacteroides sp.]
MEENNLISTSPSSESSYSGLIPIENLIHIIRGQQVMLDSDLARLYGIETKYLKRAVKANIKRFPSDFMFELDPAEFNSLRCKNCTSNFNHGEERIPFLPL